jgi:hypothetical protein
LNVSSAYSQQDVWGIQDTQRAQASGRSRHTAYSAGDTVSISPEAQERAKAAWEQSQVDQAQVAKAVQEPTLAERIAAEDAEYLASLTAPIFDLNSKTFSASPDFLTKLRPWAPHKGGNLEFTAIYIGSDDPTMQEYITGMEKIYHDVRREMGISLQQFAGLSPEEAKAFEEEVVRQMRADERINSLMEKFGINGQLDGSTPYYAFNQEAVEKHFSFLKSIFNASDEGKLTAEAMGEIMAKYARGEISADDAEKVLAQYGKDGKGTLQDSLNARVDEYRQSQRDEEAIRLLKENERLNLLMQQIGV